MDKIYQLLDRIRPTTNAAAINAAAKLPKNTLGKHYRWVDEKPNGQPFAPRHSFALVRALALVNGGSIEMDGHTIRAISVDPGCLILEWAAGEDEMFETENSFQYRRILNKSLYDVFDFNEWCETGN